METLICIVIMLAGIWVYNFIKVVYKPINSKDEADFWRLLYFTEYWHGPNDKF